MKIEISEDWQIRSVYHKPYGSYTATAYYIGNSWSWMVVKLVETDVVSQPALRLHEGLCETMEEALQKAHDKLLETIGHNS